MSYPTKTYIFRAKWLNTAINITVEAHNEADAWQKAENRKDIVGHKELILLRVEE